MFASSVVLWATVAAFQSRRVRYRKHIEELGAKPRGWPWYRELILDPLLWIHNLADSVLEVLQKVWRSMARRSRF